MKKAQGLFVFVLGIICFLLIEHLAYADETFVVTVDVVFVREDTKKVLPHENMSLGELDDEYHLQRYGSFPRHFFYGENINGTVDRENPDVVKAKITLYEWEKNKRKERKATGYIDRKKLWKEPSLIKVSTNRYMTLNNIQVYLIPDIKSKEVISLYQGEVVEVVGQLKYKGTSWIKTKFGSTDAESHYERESSGPARYGYIKESDLQPLEAGKVDESKLATSEIPKTMRYSDLTFSDKERARIATLGFYIESMPPDNKIYVDDMIDLYYTVKSSIFITSDLYLHSFHLIFDRMLQDIEEKKLFPEIENLTKKLVEATKKEIKSNKEDNDKIKKALLHNLFFFSVAAKLFDPKFVVPFEVRSDVGAIVERIVKAEGPLPSFKNKIDLGQEDFTQYRVRGHYQKRYSNTGRGEEGNIDDLVERLVERKAYQNHGKEEEGINDLLERYFRGMMWYGRHSFLLSDDTKTLSAILITHALENSGEMKRWKRIDAVLTRLIGKIDDWSPEDYSKVIEKVFSAKTPNLKDVANDDKIKDFKEQAVKMLPNQKIVSMQTGIDFTQKERLEMTSGFKFLGQRFTPDAYIFNQLTSPSVGTNNDPRNLPTSLDVMSILGSKVMLPF